MSTCAHASDAKSCTVQITFLYILNYVARDSVNFRKNLQAMPFTAPTNITIITLFREEKPEYKGIITIQKEGIPMVNYWICFLLKL